MSESRGDSWPLFATHRQWPTWNNSSHQKKKKKRVKGLTERLSKCAKHIQFVSLSWGHQHFRHQGRAGGEKRDVRKPNQKSLVARFDAELRPGKGVNGQRGDIAWQSLAARQGVQLQQGGKECVEVLRRGVGRRGVSQGDGGAAAIKACVPGACGRAAHGTCHKMGCGCNGCVDHLAQHLVLQCNPQVQHARSQAGLGSGSKASLILIVARCPWHLAQHQ